jgi:long-chain acyl-CoA synthetase
LGVEIHNAYGLTEAPLLTLNRPGANRLGTVGEPLPQTELRIAEDGEVLARGPQVMAGYFADPAGEKAQQPFRDGWLLTGDLGTFASDGSLVLKGRKKELFKTSYGKYVQPAKIESRLREIPGVTEAMLVGEQRPYCVALLWIQEDTLDEAAEQRIDRLVTEVNSGLSHPERVKRWAVLTNDLSIEAGELTANLKLKRQVIAGQLKGVLDSLYGGVVPPAAVLHIGMARKG